MSYYIKSLCSYEGVEEGINDYLELLEQSNNGGPIKVRSDTNLFFNGVE